MLSTSMFWLIVAFFIIMRICLLAGFGLTVMSYSIWLSNLNSNKACSIFLILLLFNEMNIKDFSLNIRNNLTKIYIDFYNKLIVDLKEPCPVKSPIFHNSFSFKIPSNKTKNTVLHKICNSKVFSFIQCIFSQTFLCVVYNSYACLWYFFMFIILWQRSWPISIADIKQEHKSFTQKYKINTTFSQKLKPKKEKTPKNKILKSKRF